MASVTMKRGTREEIEATPIQDGQLLIETDQESENKTNKMYLDLEGDTRVEIGGGGYASEVKYLKSDSTVSNVQDTIDNTINKIDVIGDFVDGSRVYSADTTLASGTAKSIYKILIPKGTYVLCWKANMPATSKNYRRIYLGVTKDVANNSDMVLMTEYGGNSLYGNGAIIVTVSETSKTYYLTLLQNSGASVNIANSSQTLFSLQAIRIK